MAYVLLHAYIDESGTHRGSPIMTMAGYVMTSEQAHRFSRDWGKCLNRIGIPFAHMTDCANGGGHYRFLSMEDRIRSEKLLIELIKRRTIRGFGVAIDPLHYARTVGTLKGAPTAYSFCVLACLDQISKWADSLSHNEKIAYFFEAGHQHAAEAALLLKQIPSSRRLLARHRYADHAFVEKQNALPLQAADMLAWQYCHYNKRGLEGHTTPRADYLAMLRPQDMAANYTRSGIEDFRKSLEELRAGRDPLGSQLKPPF